jgi:hypothetical protein
MDWKCDSSIRVPALQAQSPEFKPQSQKKEERKSEVKTEKKQKRIVARWVVDDRDLGPAFTHYAEADEFSEGKRKNISIRWGVGGR